jgi:hypothetical protein
MSEEKITVPSTSVDRMTLEFLMNRTQYKKYVEKTDPTKFVENETHLNKLTKYKQKILELTEELLNDPELLITLDVNESFDSYSRTLIRYFETKELEKEDVDMMFDKMDDEEDEPVKSKKKTKSTPKYGYLNETLPFPHMKSFWGKDKVIKRPSGSLLDEETDD